MGWNHQLVIFFIFIVKIFVVVIIMDDEMCPLKSEILSDRQNSLQEIWGRKFLSEFLSHQKWMAAASYGAWFFIDPD